MVDRSVVIASLRALMISRQSPATLHEINSEFRQMEGIAIPLKQFGYRSAEEFFRSEPDNFTLSKNKTNEIVVSVVVKQESSHISKLVSKQKSSSKKRRPVRSAPIPRQLNNNGRGSSQWPSYSSARPSFRRNPVMSRSARIYCDRPGKDVTYNGNYGSNRNSERFVEPSPNQEKTTSQPAKRPILKAASPVRTSSEKKPSVIRMPHNLPKPIQMDDVNKKPVTEKAAPKNKPTSSVPTSNTKQLSSYQKVSENLSLSNRLQKCREQTCNNQPPAEVKKVENQSVNINNNVISNKQPVKRTEESSKSKVELSNGEIRVEITNRKVHSAQDRLRKIRGADSPPVPTELVEIKEPPKLSSIQMRLQRHKSVEKPAQNGHTSPVEQPKNSSSAIQLTSSLPEVISSNNDEFEGDDYMKILSDYCTKKELPELSCKFIKHEIKNPKGDRPPNVFGCLIKVGNEYTYGSYSDLFSTPQEARNAAAATTYEALLKLHGTVEEVDLPVSAANVVVNGIMEIVAGHIHGKFANQIPADYRAKFHENLPENWLRLVESSSLFTVEQAPTNNKIVFLNTSAYDSDFGIRHQDITEEIVDDFHGPDNVKLPQAQTFLNVFVTCVCSTVEIWGRVIGKDFSDVYDELMTDMEINFLSNKTVASNIKIGGYYAVSTPECWCRVKVLEINNNTALCFSIDTGDEETYELFDLYILDKKFLKVPAQAFLMQLHNLEDYATNSRALPHLIDCLLNKSIVADIVAPREDNTIIDDYDGTYRTKTVVLYDTSTDDDINLNVLLFRNLSQEFSSPKLDKRIEEEVYISHISDDGEIYIQIRNESYRHLKAMINNITETGFNENDLVESRYTNASTSKLYLLFHSNSWYRVAVTNQVNDREVSVFFIDTGRSTILNSSGLLTCERLSGAIANFPHQAMKVYMTGIPQFTPTLAARLRGLLQPDSPVVLKVIKPGQIPGVEVYIRTKPQNLLLCVNTTLQFEQDMEKCSEEIICPIKNLTKRMNRLISVSQAQSPEQQLQPVAATESVESPKTISPLDIPAVGTAFPVLVTMAANPANFVVQPYKQDGSDYLGAMMKNLQMFCTHSTSNPPDQNDIKKGDLFAGLHDVDGQWYRVLVNNVMNNNSVAVQFLDYGDYAVISCNNLRKLTAAFLELPSQAIKAKLSGVSPGNGDWSVIDCLRFQKLVCNKTFVALVKSVEQDKMNPTDDVISVTLIDTSTSEDVYINSDMIQAKN